MGLPLPPPGGLPRPGGSQGLPSGGGGLPRKPSQPNNPQKRRISDSEPRRRPSWGDERQPSRTRSGEPKKSSERSIESRRKKPQEGSQPRPRRRPEPEPVEEHMVGSVKVRPNVRGEWKTDPKTGKKYKVLPKTEFTSGGFSVSTFTEDEMPDPLYDIGTAAEIFLGHLRVAPSKEELAKLRKQQAMRARRIRAEYDSENPVESSNDEFDYDEE